MNQTKQGQPQPQLQPSTNRRPKRCLVCRKMFAFEKYSQHLETCSKLEQKKIEESRARQRNTRNLTVSRNIPNIKQEVQAAVPKQGPQQANKFRIKSFSQNGQGKSKSLLAPKKPQIKQQARRSQVIEQKPPAAQIKVQREAQPILPNQSVSTQFVQQPVVPQRQQPPPAQSTVNQREERQESRASDTHPQGTLIERDVERVPPAQEGGYNIQALVDNSNAIIEFIRGISMVRDETMEDMLGQLLQLNLIASQILHLNSIGHPFGSSMANVFAARLHEMQTVITNQIGIALIRSFNQRLGSEFELLMQGRGERREGFSEEEMEELFPEKVNWSRKECSICLEDVKPSEAILELQCQHSFHPPCIREWLCSSRKCPMCRHLQQRPN